MSMPMNEGEKGPLDERVRAFAISQGPEVDDGTDHRLPSLAVARISHVVLADYSGRVKSGTASPAASQNFSNLA
jgi:hypothetical protein